MLGKRGKILLIIAVLIAIFLLIYSPHFEYLYPLHTDEWHHLEQAKKLYLGQQDLFSNFSIFKLDLFHDFLTYRYIAYPFAYHLFLQPLFIIESILHIPTAFLYTFLPAIFACLISFLLFLFIYYLTKNYWISLFSIIFLASLPSNVNLMGLWFATPFNLALALAFLFLIVFYKASETNSRKLILASFLIFCIICLIHGSVAVFLFLILIVYFAFNFKKIKENHLYLILFLPAVVFLVFLFTTEWENLFHHTLTNILSFLSFPRQETTTTLQPSITENPIVYNFLGINFTLSQYFLPILYGIIPFLLALYGIYLAIKNDKFKIWLIWLFLSISFLFIYNIAGIILFIRRQHMIYISLIALIPFSALGLYNLVLYLKNKTQRENIRKLIIGLLIIFVLFSIFYSYGSQKQGTELYHVIDDNDYQAMKFLAAQESGTVIAPLKESIAIYLISSKTAFASALEENEEKTEIVKSFFLADCTEKINIIQNYNITYIYSKSPISCNWKEIYSQERYIYKL